MTDEKDPKETSPVTEETKDDAAPKAEVETKPAEEAKLANELKAAELAEKPADPPRTLEAPKVIAPLVAKSLASHDLLAPEPGVRVRLAYRDGESIEAPADPKSRLKPLRLLAEYDTTADVIHAAEALRDAGYKSFEAHTPFPVHGMDAAMGLSDSKLGWIVLMCGLTGVSSAWLMMFWMNGVDYPLIIGGKPPDALPSMVPIMFELTVLLSAFGAVFGMFGLNRLPQHHDPLFYSDRFAAFSNDKFFISVESGDPKFEVNKTRLLLEKTKPEAIEVIETLEEVHS